MAKTIFISLPVADLAASTGFYAALGFEPDARLSDDTGTCMRWSDAIQVMLVTHAKWRTFTQRPFPPAGTSGHMLSLALDSREAVDAMNRAAAAHGGQADANPPEDHGFMYSRDIADPDGHLWGLVWMSAEIGQLHAFYAATNRNDIAEAAALFDPQVVRVEFEGSPAGGTYRGIERVRENLAQGRGTWAEGSCEPERFLQNGDKVVAFVHARVRRHGATEWTGGRFADAFAFRAGRIVGYHSFAERADALAWAGLAGAAS